MDIRAALAKEHSKKQSQLIAHYIGGDQERFDELMDLFLHDEEWRITQRAAWVLSHCADKYLFLIQPHLPNMVAYMTKEGNHVAIRRNIVRTLAKIDIPEGLMGLVADACFTFLANPKETVAVKAFSMDILYQMCKKEPDLAHELIPLIEDNMEHNGTAGILSKGRKILKKLKTEWRIKILGYFFFTTD